MHVKRDSAMKFVVIFLFSATVARGEFVDVVEQSGIDFVHFNGMIGEFYFHEMMGGGVALFDYDNDGDLDAYFTQGHLLGDAPMSRAKQQPKHPLPLTDRLYRNDSAAGRLRFTDVTDAAQIKATGYGMGVAAADFDNDGWLDLYVANHGRNQLLRNLGDGRFEDVTEASGADSAAWSVGASFFDYDKDGWLDLYVVNYVEYDVDSPVICKTYDGTEDYCSPQGFKPHSDALFHNNGDGTFSNVSARYGILNEYQPGLGVVAADFDNDGWEDLYVANDGKPNILWINNRGRGFVNKAMISGVAVDMAGTPEASMGVDAADFDNDGDLDLFMTHLNRQTNTLYVNNGKGWFADSGARMGLSASSYKSTGFGTFWIDFDNDGTLDLFSANGAVIKEVDQYKRGDAFPLKQANQLWRHNGAGQYSEVSAQQHTSFSRPSVSRGAAYGDLDNDGLLDLVVANNADQPMLLHNRRGDANNHWIGFDVRRADLKRQDLGARLELHVDGAVYHKRVKTDGSYASAHDGRVVFGLGRAQAAWLKVTWSNGEVSTHRDLAIDRYHTIQKSFSANSKAE